jgi:hypothetical protein
MANFDTLQVSLGFGWVIVTTGLDRPYYFTVYLGEMTYSADLNDAVKFAREQDAVAMLDHNFFAKTETKAALACVA